MLGLIRGILIAYEVILLIRVFSSWFPIPPSGPIRTVVSFTFTVTEPVLRPLRAILPPIRAGMMAIDLSPIIVFVVLSILISYI